MWSILNLKNLVSRSCSKSISTFDGSGDPSGTSLSATFVPKLSGDFLFRQSMFGTQNHYPACLLLYILHTPFSKRELNIELKSKVFPGFFFETGSPIRVKGD